MAQLQEIFSLIDQSSYILLISHRKPDGDTLGSTIAMGLYLKEKKKKFTLFCIDSIPMSFSYLPMNNDYVQEGIDISIYDLIMVFDSADEKQGALPEILSEKPIPIINIDHHHTNKRFGAINYVQTISSTCELVYRIFLERNIDISADMATSLLTGIMTDTDGFTNPATTQEAIHAGSDLMRKGARFKQIMKHILKNKRVQDLQLWGKILSTLHTSKEWGCAASIITLEDLMKYDVDEEATIGIANFLNLLSDMKMALVIRELPDGRIKGSFRTNQDDVDVSRLARYFGGGGHKKAAGFTISGHLKKTKTGWEIY